MVPLPAALSREAAGDSWEEDAGWNFVKPTVSATGNSRTSAGDTAQSTELLRGATRQGYSMDFSARSAGSTALAEERRQRMNVALSLGSNVLTAGRQVHGDHIEVVSSAPAGRERHLFFPSTDALVTNVPGVTLFSLHADCVPILLYDPERRVVGLAHAGWKGTILRIAGKTVAKMADTFGCRPGDILAAIGPSIGPQCYEVGEDVVTAVREEFEQDELLVPRGDSRWSFDLWAANHLSLLEIGVLAANIENSHICTHCRCDEFFSHRAEKGQAGRFGAFIAVAN